MRIALAAVLIAACAAPSPRPPQRIADHVTVAVVQIGWTQINAGQLNRPTVEDVTSGLRQPDEQGATHIAQDVLAKCRSGAPMEPLQRRYSEAPPGLTEVDVQTKKPYRDVALSLKPGECALLRSGSALHVLKRVG